MLGEVAPFLVPQFDALLVSLLAVAGCIVAIGIVAVLHTFVRATIGGVAWVVSEIPVVGSVLASPVNAVWHWMDHEFAGAESALDGILARYLSSLSQLVRWLGNEIAAHADLLYTIASVMAGPATILYLETLIGNTGRAVSWAGHELGAVAGRVAGLEQQVQHAATGELGVALRDLTAPIVGEIQTLERWTYPRVQGLEQAVEQTIPRDIAGLRERARAIETELEHAYSRIASLEHATSLEALTAVVAVAAAELGFDWARCRNWRGIGRGICGTPGRLIEALLTGAIEAFLVTDICQLAEVIEAEAVMFEPVLQEFVNAQRFICLMGGAHYAAGITAADLRGGGGHPTGIVPADLAA